ncbi:hypothetical protein V8C35DRAFT_15366 [Trichoderma chlorosporum]
MEQGALSPPEDELVFLLANARCSDSPYAIKYYILYIQSPPVVRYSRASPPIIVVDRPSSLPRFVSGVAQRRIQTWANKWAGNLHKQVLHVLYVVLFLDPIPTVFGPCNSLFLNNVPGPSPSPSLLCCFEGAVAPLWDLLTCYPFSARSSSAGGLTEDHSVIVLSWCLYDTLNPIKDVVLLLNGIVWWHSVPCLSSQSGI